MERFFFNGNDSKASTRFVLGRLPFDGHSLNPGPRYGVKRNFPQTSVDSFDEVVVTVQTGYSVSALFAADTQNHRIQRFDGNVWTVVVGNGVPGTAANRCNLPKAVTASADGNRI